MEKLMLIEETPWVGPTRFIEYGVYDSIGTSLEKDNYTNDVNPNLVKN